MNSIGIKILDLVIATLFGAIIGYVREKRNKNAGVKTNSIVALASCLLVAASLEYGDEGIMRVAAQIVSGVGFLGAGIILVKARKEDEEQVKVQGLTSAATVWFSAAIGIVTPLEDGIVLAAVATGIFLFIIEVFGRLETVVFKHNEEE